MKKQIAKRYVARIQRVQRKEKVESTIRKTNNRNNFPTTSDNTPLQQRPLPICPENLNEEGNQSGQNAEGKGHWNTSWPMPARRGGNGFSKIAK